MDWAAGPLIEASDALFLALNGLSGRSWLLDTLVSLAIDNSLVKAAPVAAAFVFAWHAGPDPARHRARRVLIATVAALVLVLGVTKTLADSIFLPRPFVLAEQTYHVEDGRLAETERLAFRQPQAGFSHGRQERLREGEIDSNDLNSFPSDHAAFYFALALGIFLASRRAGTFALAWVVVVICGSRIVTGAHSPLDVACGIGIGGAILIAVQLLASRWASRPFDFAASWTVRRPALAAALLFLILFEAAGTLENTRDLLRTGKQVAARSLGA